MPVLADAIAKSVQAQGAEVQRALQRTWPAHADHRVLAWDNVDGSTDIEVWCSCKSTGRLTEHALQMFGQDNQTIKEVCRCPMLVGGGIDHRSDCADRPSKR